MKSDAGFDAVKALDKIERGVYAELKPHGFRKFGRTLHRFVDGDLSQVIHFQLGQAYLDATHFLSVNIGIRVPECALRSFAPEEAPKKYYHEYNCNLRSRLGEVEGRAASCYDLRGPLEPIEADILRQIRDVVIPAFDALNSRDAILVRRRDYPQLDTFRDHMILLEEAMIYGRRGELERASEAFNRYYRLFGSAQLAQKDPSAIQDHLRYLDGLATALGIAIEPPSEGEGPR